MNQVITLFGSSKPPKPGFLARVALVGVADPQPNVPASDMSARRIKLIAMVGL